MKYKSVEEAMETIVKNCHTMIMMDETDNEGQVVIYTGVYQWKDGSFHDESEPIQD